MNLYHYAIDFVLASLAITLILHISKCDRKYLTRAEFDEHLAACRDGVVDNPLVYCKGIVRQSARRNVSHISANNHADAALRGCPDLCDRHHTAADVADTDALHGDEKIHFPATLSRGNEHADTRSVKTHPLEVAAKRVEEMRNGNDSRRDSEN